ncbi:TauD/TfdA family dioxygenase [Siccirubricoccus sp. KC 17139]|uniref:TauD/TfdA family dioxygenase n=1 Tax=Siccirubricoccus soli TaxID=2899147 RepID=A0ABT1D3W3_9PROT|nr:TauD/TfdA family dioxygenase [Siccirubricoccus soli]MCO6416606.1 TauD/TfdA family dioxygenase [Siccirubricoccus soli]MCP2682741.1 TauD/TfdA family dioxygenase [Siccirubricoccus soli]
MELPPGKIGGAAAWTGADMAARQDWIVTFSPDELAEIDAAIAAHRAAGRQMGEITAESFRLPRLAARLDGVLGELLHGRGFVLLRGFDVSRRTIEEAAIGYLGIGAHLGGFRSQNAKGHLLGHVKDLGLDIRNPKVRYYQTNKELEFHTDSCDIVGLLCLKTAKSGGGSRIVSSVALHDRLLEESPELWRALFNPMPTDRRGEIPPGMLPWFEIPVFNWYQGELSTIYSGQYIRSAQANFPEARRLTEVEIAALARLDALAAEMSLEMEFRPGDMQFIHNHQILHSRTDFEDWPEPERRRHLLRLWLSPKGGRALPPAYAQRYGDITPGNRGGIVVQDTVLRFTLEPA